jgi:hypothetical protein
LKASSGGKIDRKSVIKISTLEPISDLEYPNLTLSTIDKIIY